MANCAETGYSLWHTDDVGDDVGDDDDDGGDEDGNVDDYNASDVVVTLRDVL